MITVLRAASGIQKRHSVSSAMHMAREAMWDCWEGPRLPRPLISRKYPTTWPWSPGARAAIDVAGGKRPTGGYGLILEHLAPRGLVIARLIDNSAKLTPETFIEILSRDMRGAVISRQEDALLNKAKVGRSYPKGANPVDRPWCRYEVAGLDPAEFAPIAQ